MKQLFEGIKDPGTLHEGRGVREVIYSLLLRLDKKMKKRLNKFYIDYQNEREGGGGHRASLCST